MKKQAYLLRSLQKRLDTQLYLVLKPNGSGFVKDSFDSETIFIFNDEDEFYEQIKLHLNQ